MGSPLRRVRLVPAGNVRTISAANFLTGTYQTVLNVVLQPFVLRFTGSVAVLGILQALSARVSGLVGTVVQPLGGYLADRRGRRPVAILGSGFTIAGLGALLLASRFPGEPWALPALVLPGFVGIGMGLLSVPALGSSVAESSEPRRRASAYATTAFFWVLPGALLAIPGGLLADRLGYGAVFGVALAFEAVNLVLFARFLRETRAGGPVHTWRERMRASLRPPREVRGLFWVTALDALAWGLAAGIIYGLLSKRFGFSNTELAAIAASWALFFALFLPPTAVAVNRIGPKRVILFSESLGVPIMAGWLLATRPEEFAAVAVLGGLTAATWVPAVQTYLANWTTRERRAEVLGSLAAFRGLVAFPAPFLGGALYDLFGYAVPILANLAGAAAVTVGIAFLLKDPPPGGVEPAPPEVPGT